MENKDDRRAAEAAALKLSDALGSVDSPEDLQSWDDKVILLCVHFAMSAEFGEYETWFKNPTGIYVSETISALTEIGAAQAAGIIQQLASLLPGDIDWKNAASRWSAIDSIEARFEIARMEADKKYASSCENIYRLLVEWWNRRHPDSAVSI